MPNQSLKTFSSFFEKKSTAIVNNLGKQLKMIKLLFFYYLSQPFLLFTLVANPKITKAGCRFFSYFWSLK